MKFFSGLVPNGLCVMLAQSLEKNQSRVGTKDSYHKGHQRIQVPCILKLKINAEEKLGNTDLP